MKKILIYFLILFSLFSVFTQEINLSFLHENGFPKALFFVEGAFSQKDTDEYLVALGNYKTREVQELIVLQYTEGIFSKVITIDNSWSDIISESDFLYPVLNDDQSYLGAFHSCLYSFDNNKNGLDEIFLFQISGIALHFEVLEFRDAHFKSLFSSIVYPSFNESFSSDKNGNIYIVDKGEQVNDNLYKLEKLKIHWDGESDIYSIVEKSIILARQSNGSTMLSKIDEK